MPLSGSPLMHEVGKRILGRYLEHAGARDVELSPVMRADGTGVDIRRLEGPTTITAKVKVDYYFGSDQAWISFKIRGRLPGWTQNHGVYSYPRDVRKRQPFPHNARIVIFHGKRKPWDPIMETEAPWIAKHWRIV